MTAIPMACTACAGEGRDIRAGWVYEPGCTHAHIGDLDYGSCRTCEGTGDEFVEIVARNLDDMLEEDEGDPGPDPERCPCGFTAEHCTPYRADCLYALED